MLESTDAKIDGLAASQMDRRNFLKGAAGAAGTVAAVSMNETARAIPASRPDVPWDPNSRMGIGIRGSRRRLARMDERPDRLLTEQ